MWFHSAVRIHFTWLTCILHSDSGTQRTYIPFLDHSSHHFHLPIVVLLIVIFSNESRFHLTTGGGLPCARHRNVKLFPSRTITSLELRESSIFGGTNWRHTRAGRCAGNSRRIAIQLEWNEIEIKKKMKYSHQTDWGVQ